MNTGKVNKIDSITTAMGVMYNVNVDGTRYGFGKQKPNFNEGDVITFDFTQKGQYKNIVPSTVEVKKDVVVPIKTSNNSTGNSKDDYWAQKEQRDVGTQRGIQQQSARNAAIAFIIPLATAGLIKLPAKAEDKLSAVASLVDEFTDRYYNATQLAISGEYQPEDVSADSVPFSMGNDD